MNRRRPKGRNRQITEALAVAATTPREAVTADV
jgi:hypothetical protein